MLSITEALETISSKIPSLEPTARPLQDAHNLLLAEEIRSPLNTPPFDKSCMDGYAVRSADFNGTAPTLNVIGEITAGNVSTQTVAAGQTIRIMTGAPLPEGADAVIQHELTTLSADEKQVQFESTAIPAGLNVIQRGGIMQEGELIFAPLTKLRPQELTVLAEMGFANPAVYAPPRIAVLATGDELVPIEQELGPGQIRNTNEIMLVEQIRQAGGIPVPLGIARDNAEELTKKIKIGLQHDMLILSGGVSAGKLDLVPSILESLNVQEIFHKVHMKPGKPVWFGAQNQPSEERPTFVFGLPGNPVSSMVCFELFAKTGLKKLAGHTNLTCLPTTTSAVLVKDHFHKGDRPTFWPVHFKIEDSQATVTPLNWRGSSDLKGTLSADGMALFSKPDFTYKSGTTIDYYPWN